MPIFIILIEIQLVIAFIALVIAMFSRMLVDNNDLEGPTLFFLKIAGMFTVSSILTALLAFACFHIHKKYFKRV